VTKVNKSSVVLRKHRIVQFVSIAENPVSAQSVTRLIEIRVALIGGKGVARVTAASRRAMQFG
jgi:hypothetical protein